MFIPYNPNPKHLSVGDCTVRAISKVLDQSWDKTFWGLCSEGFLMCNMPSGDDVWGMYLKNHGFHKEAVEDCKVYEYALGNIGRCVLKLSGHVVALIDEDWYDTTDSGDGYVLYVWRTDR